MNLRRKRRMANINAVPYVDVMLALLIIFMASAPLLSQGFSVNLPEVAAGRVDLPDPIVVSVLADETYRINVGESQESRASAETISIRIKKILARNPKLSILVEGDSKVSYKSVLSLISILQQAGINKVGLATNPPVDIDES